jgi:hypothetical protein
MGHGVYGNFCSNDKEIVAENGWDRRCQSGQQFLIKLANADGGDEVGLEE